MSRIYGCGVAVVVTHPVLSNVWGDTCTCDDHCTGGMELEVRGWRTGNESLETQLAYPLMQEYGK